jgi:hypothetical protein
MSDKVSEIIYLSYVITVLIILVSIVLLGLRFRSMWLQRRELRYLRKHHDYFEYVKAHLYGDQPLQKPAGPLKKAELRVLQGKLFEWMERITGAECDKLTVLCRHLGFVDLHMKRLESEIHWTRLDAVHSLGIMQASEAVPLLLQLLEEERYGSASYVIARSITKCTILEGELDQMVRLLVKHRKQSHRLISGILVLSRMDYVPLLMDYLQEPDTEFVKIALTGLQTRTIPGGQEILPSFISMEDSELRLLAVQAMVHQGNKLTSEQMSELMHHEDVDVRAEAADAFGQVGVVSSVEPLKEGLEDSDRRVRYKSARSLVGLDAAGFRALCEVAQQGGNSREALLAQHVIQEEMAHGAVYSEDLEQAVRYNMRRDIYLQFFSGHQLAAKENSNRLNVLAGDTA